MLAHATQRILPAGLILATGLALGACAATGTAGGGGPVFGSSEDCFFAASMTDWRPLDDRNLVVFTGVRRPYHVQLSTPARSLRFQDTIAFTDRDGRICPFGGDSVVINGAMVDRITIASIRRLTEGQLEELYASFGIRRPAVIEAPEEAVQ